MNDTPEQTPEEIEAERIRKWREERAITAEKEKQERVRLAKENRAKELAEKDNENKIKAAALLPSEESLQKSRSEVLRKMRAVKRRLLYQFLVFVILPTMIVVGYLGFVAVPLYEARAVVTITKPGGEKDTGLGGILGSIGGASNMQDVFMAAEYIKSQALMDKLEEEMGLISFYGSPAMDPVRRLKDREFLGISKHAMFSNFVTASTNIQTGLLTLYARAPSPELAVEISENLMDLTAAHINELSREQYKHRTALSRTAVADARIVLTEAQTNLTKLQISSREANPKLRIEGVYATIRLLEDEVLKLETQVQQAELAGQADAYQTKRLVMLKEGLEERIQKERDLLVKDPSPDQRSLNKLLLEYELALLQVRIAEETLSAALLTLNKASDDSALAQVQFQVVVPPRTATIPSFPNIPKNTFVTFLIFLSILSIFKLLLPAGKVS